MNHAVLACRAEIIGLLRAERARTWLMVAGVVAGIAGTVIVYPHLIEAALTRFGVRATSGALFALTLVSIALSRFGGFTGRGAGNSFAGGIAPVLGFPLLLGLAAISDDVHQESAAGTPA